MEKMTTKIFNIVYYTICAVAFVVSFILSVKQRRKQKNITKLQALYECIPGAVINAEKLFGAKNGKNKKLFVMTTLSNIGLQSRTKFDYDELDKRVEDVVKATKNVNVAQNVDETFRAGNDAQSGKAGLADAAIKADKADGSVVLEIEKIKGSDKNGTNN